MGAQPPPAPVDEALRPNPPTFPGTRNEDELRLRAILILAITAISASAQIPELRVSLRELTGEAIKNNPAIAAAQKKYEAARQRPAAY